MKTVLMWVVVAALVGAGAAASGEVVSVDMTVTPPAGQTNQLEVTFTATAYNIERSDSDTAVATGNVIAEIEVYFDPVTREADVNAIEFTGGVIVFSDMSFVLDYGLLGRVDATAVSMGGTPTSPSGPAPVVDDIFYAANHLLLLNQGQFRAVGSGLIGDLVGEVIFDLAAQPMQIESDALGAVSVLLESVVGDVATYSATITLPVIFSDEVFGDETVTAIASGVGVVEATGTFTRQVCTLRSNLAGEGCRIDMVDVAEFARQWLADGDPLECPLTADLQGDDCHVAFGDFSVLLADWGESDE